MKKQSGTNHKQKINPEHAIRTGFFEMAMRKAKRSITDPNRMLKLIQNGLSKINSLENKGDVISGMKNNFGLLVRMLIAFYNKQYTRISLATLLKVGAAIIYFLFVIDFIPDFIPAIGFLDDASVLAWVIASVKEDIDKFRKWENSRQ